MNGNYMTWEQAVLWLKKQPERLDLIRACFYDDPLHESAERYYQSTEWKAVRKLIYSAKGGKALDIGAGRGISSYALARDGWHVTALEPDPSNIVGSGAIKNMLNFGVEINVVEDYGEMLPFEENSYNLVYGRAVLHHAKDITKFCVEAARVLRTGGMFIATREHVISKKGDLERFLTTHPLHSLYGGENAFLLKTYKNAIEGAGIKIHKVLGPYDSDINLFPSNKKELRSKISKKIGFNIPIWMEHNLITPFLNKIDNTPGRLFSFIGIKS